MAKTAHISAADQLGDNAGVTLNSLVGPALRAERERQGVTLRALAGRVGISPSAMSQIETGRSRPSVSTLYAIVSELGLSLDALFAGAQDGGNAAGTPADVHRPDAAPLPESAPEEPSDGPVQRGASRKAIELDSGVRWERLTVQPDSDVDFLYVEYEVEGASSRDRKLTRHGGHEYGLVLSGRLRVTIGFESYDLGPGDSISFASSLPHLLENVGDEPVTGIWVVVGRHGDARV